MSRYSKIQSSIWSSDKFRSVRSFSQLVYFYLITCEHKNNDLYYEIPINIAIKEIGCLKQKYDLAIKELVNAKLIEYNNEVVKDIGGFTNLNYNKKRRLKHFNEKVDKRTHSEYIDWRRVVFERDNYTCVSCGARGKRLNAHHIKSYAKYPDLRIDVENGITLCESCHKKYHKENGR